MNSATTKQHIHTFVDSKAGLMFIGFVLTTILGTAFNQMYQRQAWEREVRTELLKRSLEKHEKLVNELSALTSGRAFRLERLIWAIENPILEDRTATHQEVSTMTIRWKEYYDNVVSWNEIFRVIFSKLSYLVGKEASKSFYAGEDESKKEDSLSLYGAFRSAHIAVLKLYRCATATNCNKRKKLLVMAQERKNRLNSRLDEYLLELNIQLNKRLQKMKQL